MRPFTGKTSKGIALGATVKEIETAYGPPTIKKSNSKGQTGLYYKSLGITFELKDDRLHSMSLDKPQSDGA